MTDKQNPRPLSLEILAVTLILMLISFPRIINTPFHIDESSWIGNSYFFEDWFRFDPQTPLWQINDQTLGDPNMTKFIIAVGRIITGFSRDELNKPYDYTVDFTQNSDRGHIPNPNLLYASRIPMAALTVMVGILLFIQFYRWESWAMAYGWIFLLVQNTLLLQVMSRAMNEAPVLLFTLISSLCSYLGFVELVKNNTQGETKASFSFLLAGVSLGLAFSTKISAILILFPTITILGIQIFSRGSFSFKHRMRLFLKLFLLYFLAALLIVILLHPFLYRNPVAGIFQMLTFRASKLADQSAKYTDFSQLPLLQRWWEILRRLFTTYTAFDFPYEFLLNIPIAMIGFLNLGKQIAIDHRQSRLPSVVVMLILLLSLLVIAGFMSPLDWDRYFIFPVFVMTIIYAKGLEAILLWLHRRLTCVLKKKSPAGEA
ncbi:MAG: phospholipid carrier-dependent glycosyltransferase [Anaerolineae bacterium]|jgi:hypothetical protein|nr:phospholipid carrier-dependent glycosyltransferase [Anaerolineae bacterium]